MTNRELFVHRTLETFPVWTHQGGGKRHVYAAAFVTDSLCGTMKRHATRERNEDDELRNVTCKLCRAKVIADLHGLLETIFRHVEKEGEPIESALLMECDGIEEQWPYFQSVTILRRLATLAEETRKWVDEQERLKRAARFARRGRTGIVIHETTL